MGKYISPERIPETVVRGAFEKASAVDFETKHLLTENIASIGIAGIDWPLPVKRLLPIVGIEPGALDSFFYEARQAPFGPVPFGELAGVLGKPVAVKVKRPLGGYNLLFTVNPSGAIVYHHRKG